MITLSDVVLGGCSSYDTSECHRSIFANALGSGRREPSLYTTVCRIAQTVSPHIAHFGLEEEGRTVHFLESWFAGNACCGMLVERAEVPVEFE